MVRSPSTMLQGNASTRIQVRFWCESPFTIARCNDGHHAEATAGLMSLNADTELQFDDDVLPANSYVLSFFSSVLRGAVEAAKSEGHNSTIVIPMRGVTTKQWLAVAPFWHPVEPAAVVKGWKELELVLRIGSRFDLRPALDRGSDFLAANIHELTVDSIKPTISTRTGPVWSPTPSGGIRIHSRSSEIDSADTTKDKKGLWKWLRLADELRLTTCLPALVKRAVSIDKAGCRVAANRWTHVGLSAATLQQMVTELAGGTCSYY